MKETASTWMEATLEVAKQAGEVALRHFQTGVAVDRKQDGSPVTEGDRQAERCAREWIEARFPEDGILGEEFGEVRPGAQRRWLIDPIDGTASFVHRVPLWGTLIALVEGETVQAGAAWFPALRESVVAAPGYGCWWNGARCQVSAVVALEDATVLISDPREGGAAMRARGWDRLGARARLVRTWGDCYGYLLVATGRAEVMLDPVLSAWDAAPMMPIIEEAGGVFTDWDGARTPFAGSAVATNAGLAAATRELLRPSEEAFR
jgi:histidinol-phosphatase